MRRILERGAVLALIVLALGAASLILWPQGRMSQLIVASIETPPPYYFADDPGPGFQIFYPLRTAPGERQLVRSLSELPPTQRASAGRFVVPERRSPKQILEGPQVTIYAASWCGYCKKMLRELSKLGIDAEQKDIERSAEIAAELIARSGGRAIPFTLVEGVGIYGYDPQRLATVLASHQAGD